MTTSRHAATNRFKVIRERDFGELAVARTGPLLTHLCYIRPHFVLAFTFQILKPDTWYSRDADDFCEEHPDVVLLASSILSTDAVLRSLPLARLKRNTLFVDVLSVKEFPKCLFLQVHLWNFGTLRSQHNLICYKCCSSI